MKKIASFILIIISSFSIQAQNLLDEFTRYSIYKIIGETEHFVILEYGKGDNLYIPKGEKNPYYAGHEIGSPIQDSVVHFHWIRQMLDSIDKLVDDGKISKSKLKEMTSIQRYFDLNEVDSFPARNLLYIDLIADETGKIGSVYIKTDHYNMKPLLTDEEMFLICNTLRGKTLDMSKVPYPYKDTTMYSPYYRFSQYYKETGKVPKFYMATVDRYSYWFSFGFLFPHTDLFKNLLEKRERYYEKKDSIMRARKYEIKAKTLKND